MTLETLFPVIFIPLFVHAGLISLQSFWKGASQYDDLSNVQINGLSNPMNIQQLLNMIINGRLCCRDLLAAILIWSRCLRVIALIPILLYIAFFVLLIVRGTLKEEIDVTFLTNVLFGSAPLIQVMYLILKIYSKIPDLLKNLRSEVYGNSSPLLILFDIAPLWRR